MTGPLFVPLLLLGLECLLLVCYAGWWYGVEAWYWDREQEEARNCELREMAGEE